MRIVIFASLARSLVNFRGPLVKSLCDLGLEVHAVAPDIIGDKKTFCQLQAWGVIIHDVRLQRTAINPLQDISTFFSYLGILRKVQPDIVLSYTIKPVIYGTLAARVAKVPKRLALITGLGYAFTGDAKGKRRLVQKMARSLYSQALKRTDLVYFQNPDDKALFRALGLVPEAVPTLVVNGSGIDLTSFDLVPLPDGPPRFLLIARLLGDKGVREYVNAAAYVRTRYPHIQFRLVGDLDSNPDSISGIELDDWIKAGHIEYLGRLDDVRPAIGDASVYVLPSYREGTPRTVLEAMAMGRAVITTDAPGCRETVVEGDNGYLVPVKNADALALAMLRFIEQPCLIKSMGKRAREVAVNKYDVDKVNAQMLQGMGINPLKLQLSRSGGI